MLSIPMTLLVTNTSLTHIQLPTQHLLPVELRLPSKFSICSSSTAVHNLPQRPEQSFRVAGLIMPRFSLKPDNGSPKDRVYNLSQQLIRAPTSWSSLTYVQQPFQHHSVACCEPFLEVRFILILFYMRFYHLSIGLELEEGGEGGGETREAWKQQGRDPKRNWFERSGNWFPVIFEATKFAIQNLKPIVSGRTLPLFSDQISFPGKTSLKNSL